MCGVSQSSMCSLEEFCFLFYKLPFMRDDPLLENLKPVVLKDYNGEDVGERKGKSKPGTHTVSITYV